MKSDNREKKKIEREITNQYSFLKQNYDFIKIFVGSLNNIFIGNKI